MGVTGTYLWWGGGGLRGDVALLHLCGVDRGHVAAGGAHEAGLVGCRIVTWLLMWRPSVACSRTSALV